LCFSFPQYARENEKKAHEDCQKINKNWIKICNKQKTKERFFKIFKIKCVFFFYIIQVKTEKRP
jgi:hypothetical protein